MLEAGLGLQQAPPIDPYDQWNGMPPITEGLPIFLFHKLTHSAAPSPPFKAE